METIAIEDVFKWVEEDCKNACKQGLEAAAKIADEYAEVMATRWEGDVSQNTPGRIARDIRKLKEIL